jgi:hypothetical protein
MILWAFVAASSAAAAPVTETRKGFPHRDWGEVATIDLPIDLAQSCVVQQLMTSGRVVSLPVENGSDVYFAVHSLMANGPPYVRFMLRKHEDKTHLRALYRRPFGRGTVSGFVADLQAMCTGAASPGSGETAD